MCWYKAQYSPGQNSCAIQSQFSVRNLIKTYSVSRSWPGLCGTGTSINSKTLWHSCHRNVDIGGCNTSWIFDGGSTSCIAVHILLTWRKLNYLLFHYSSNGAFNFKLFTSHFRNNRKSSLQPLQLCNNLGYVYSPLSWLLAIIVL